MLKIIFELEKESRGWLYRQAKISLLEEKKKKELDIKVKEDKDGQLKLILGGTNGNY